MAAIVLPCSVWAAKYLAPSLAPDGRDLLPVATIAMVIRLGTRAPRDDQRDRMKRTRPEGVGSAAYSDSRPLEGIYRSDRP